MPAPERLKTGRNRRFFCLRWLGKDIRDHAHVLGNYSPGVLGGRDSGSGLNDKAPVSGAASAGTPMAYRPDHGAHCLATTALDRARATLERHVIRKIPKLRGTAEDHRDVEWGLLLDSQRQQAAKPPRYRIAIVGPLLPGFRLDGTHRGPDVVEHLGNTHLGLR
ncbi:hypothetical protein PO002_04690 [Cupriavidus necator]